MIGTFLIPFFGSSSSNWYSWTSGGRTTRRLWRSFFCICSSIFLTILYHAYTQGASIIVKYQRALEKYKILCLQVQILLASKYNLLYSAQPMNIHSPEPQPEFAEPTGEESRHYSESNPKWFMASAYRPCPQYDVEVGDYVFRYRPEYDSYFIQESMNGRTLSSISADLSIPTTVIKRWSREIKSFAVSLELARQHALAYWENLGRTGMMIKGFNMGGWLRTMEVMFKEWAEPEDSVADPLGIGDEGPSNVLIFQGVPGYDPDLGHDGAMRGIA